MGERRGPDRGKKPNDDPRSVARSGGRQPRPRRTEPAESGDADVPASREEAAAFGRVRRLADAVDQALRGRRDATSR